METERLSKQQSYMPEIEERDSTGSKKRKGNFELWQKYNGDLNLSFLKNEWHKIRSYETRELAEKNLKDFDRKWNYGNTQFKWLFEIREVTDK